MTKADRIEAALREALQPQQLTVVNESHRHVRGEETHYNVIAVSDAFRDQSRLARQRLVHGALGPLMGEIHSLTMKTLTPDELSAAGGEVSNPSPDCGGG